MKDIIAFNESKELKELGKARLSKNNDLER